MTPYMDPVLFKAAEAGDIDPFENYQTCLNQLLTPDENTILHVYLKNQSREPESSTKLFDFVDKILEMCPPLLFQANKKGEIPLHFAARYGHSNEVRVLIDRAKARPTDPESGVTEAKKMLRMTNEEKDTALHVAARHIQAQVVEILTKEDPEFSYSANVHGETPLYIVDIILEMCPPLLFQANKKEETPLHLAARYGHSNVVRVLIDRAKARPTDPESGVTEAKKMLRKTNKEKDTALHEAARNRRSHVVEILTKEDPEFSYSANVHGETPLYIVASIMPRWSEERGQVIDEILTNCISVDYGGPNGRTALHAASRVGDDETARKLLEKEKTLTKTTDENGWSPLHYAAFYDWSARTVKVLLEYDASAAYIAETEKKRTALHIAAIRGRVNAMKEIVSGCPACCELVDNRGWNALHYAVASKRTKAFKECLGSPELARLKTKKDDKGNTPFHLIAALAHQQQQWRRVIYERGSGGLNKRKLSVNDIYSGNLGEIQKEILESLEDVGSGPIGRSPFVLKGKQEKNNDEKNKVEEEALSKARESHLVVATLIATITFIAAFTLPGSYKSDRGTAILAKKAAFIVFVILDAMSLVLSIFAVFIHFLMALILGIEMDKYGVRSKDIIRRLFGVAMMLMMIGMGIMIIAFITDTYAVLESSLGLVIITCLIGLSFFFFVSLVFRII